MVDYAWAGRTLVVDLTTGRSFVRDTSDLAAGYIGGRGLGAALAWELLQPGMKPFDPDCPLMFLCGPLAATAAPNAGRVTICSLTPQGYPVPWFSRASMGGDLGHHIRMAGYDGILILGQAPHPVYLWVQDDQVELRDARDVWGLGIMDTQESLRARLGPRVQTASIGPAGENLSCIATIGSNEGSAAGQGGFGAVMGAKKLKAVAVYGSHRPKLAKPEAFRTLTKAIAREYLDDTNRRQAQSASSGSAAPSSAPYGLRRIHCSSGCIMGCATHYEGVRGTIFPDRDYGGIVQCTAGRFRGAEGHYWNIGFEAGFELNMLANDWGINHWDLMKGLFPWIGMCYRAGLMSHIGGREITPNDPRFWYEVLQTIATHQGPMAEVVADGGRRAIARTGLLPDEGRQLYTGWGYANHWDGRGPRGNQITYPFWLVSALLWMIDTRDPMGSAHGYVQNMTGASPFGRNILSWDQLQGIAQRLYGRPEAMDPLSDYEGKAEAALWHARRAMLKDSLPLCDRIFPRLISSVSEDGLPRAGGVEGPEFEYHLYAMATGHDVGPEELDRAADRALTLERLEQIRDFGRTRAQDNAVVDFFCETDEEHVNPLLGERRRAQQAPLLATADPFYTLRGLDPTTGIPSQGAIDRVGLADQVAARA
jgi:aldehyde:ferredoxin oxidoreductase